MIHAAQNDSFRVILTGDLLGNDGGGPLGGLAAGNRAHLFALISRLQTAWRNTFVRFQADEDVVRQRYPFADAVDLRRYQGTSGWDNAMRELARVGYEIFRAVFVVGDPSLAQAGEQLCKLLRTSPQVITFHSDDVFVPWHMLYVPPDGQDMLEDNCPWSFDGFIGYRHRIEHVLSDRPDNFRHQLETTGGIRVGLHIDSDLDKLTPPVLQPLRDLLGHVSKDRISSAWREKRADLARALKSDTCADQIIFFGCHGTVGAAGHNEAYLALTDRQPVYTSNFQDWLSGRTLEQSPIVLVNACEGGQLSSMYLEAFGKVLLGASANCLAGPQIDVPAAFAGQYAVQFFRELLRGVAVGDVVQGLARGFADRYANPLGLVISLYRGMDTYFDVSNSDDPDPATERILVVPDGPAERCGAPA
jgi:hypothetical protein